MGLRELDDNGFDETVGSAPGPVVVDFWATWCGPCRSLAPVLEELAASEPRVQVVKVDVDRSPSLAARFEIQSVPTLVVLRDGSPVARLTGARGLTQLRADLEPHL